jgi:hypothetical protein
LRDDLADRRSLKLRQEMMPTGKKQPGHEVIVAAAY